MTNRIANTAAKIPAASSGPRQLSTMLLPGLLSDMVEQLPLILAVRSHCLLRQHMGPIPNAIELPQAAAQFLRNFCPRLNGRLGTPPPSARKLIEIFAIRAIADISMSLRADGGGVPKRPLSRGQKFLRNCAAACGSSIAFGMGPMC